LAAVMSRRPVGPVEVFLAGFMLAGVAAAQAVAAIVSVYAVPYARALYSDRAADDAEGNLAVVGLVVLTVTAVITALVHGILAPLVGRGSDAGRILGWVAVGCTVVVCAVLLLLAPFAAMDWYRRITLVTTVASLAFAAAAAALMGLPAARAYYRRGVRPAARRRAAPYPGPYFPPYPAVPPPYRSSGPHPPYGAQQPYLSPPPYPPPPAGFPPEGPGRRTG
jgi:hypothetical protein